MFIEYGLNIQNPIPTKKLLERLAVSKTERTAAARKVNPRVYQDHESDHVMGSGQEQIARETYQAVEHQEQDSPVLHARQIMTSPIVCLNNEMTVSEALQLFKQHKYRHMPVITKKGELTGIVADRDMLHFNSELSNNYEQQAKHHNSDPISRIMSTPVLTANVETDVRYIARLFVAQHIGAMPIMAEGQLTGMITRTDIMRAVMQHFILELWI